MTGVLPERFDSRFARGFGWYAERLLRKRFHAVRLLAGDGAALAELEASPGPAIVAMNHPSWWDPITAFFVARRFTPGRRVCAPMERGQLEKFGFFRRIGIFGIDPADPESAALLVAHVARRFEEAPRTTLWITPQGSFADVRAPLRLRPGAAQVAARTAAGAEGATVAVLAIEYAFWEEQRPEIFLGAGRVAVAADAAPSTSAWHRAIERALDDCSARLAAAVVARDPGRFELLLGGAARIHPLYDAWLRLRGRKVAIDAGPSGHARSPAVEGRHGGAAP